MRPPRPLRGSAAAGYVDRAAGSRLGRAFLVFAVGGTTIQLVRQVRNLIELVDVIERHGAPKGDCAECAEKRGAVEAVDGPTPAPEGDPLPESDGA